MVYHELARLEFVLHGRMGTQYGKTMRCRKKGSHIFVWLVRTCEIQTCCVCYIDRRLACLPAGTKPTSTAERT